MSESSIRDGERVARGGRDKRYECFVLMVNNGPGCSSWGPVTSSGVESDMIRQGKDGGYVRWEVHRLLCGGDE